jgi:archaemetzincin
MTLSINLQEIGGLDRSTLRTLKKNLKWALKKFNLQVEILEEAIRLTKKEFNSHKRQFDANLIMHNLYDAYKKQGGFRILGVMDKDIYVDPYHFIFGSARNPSKIYARFSPVALISVCRLREEYYELNQNQALFELRVLKEALHELGHTFGLFHCENDCVMIFSNSIEDTDKKPPQFCSRCSDYLERFFQNNF